MVFEDISTTSYKEKIEKLEERKRKIEEQLSRQRAKIRQQARRDETRRKILVGAWYMSLIESGERSREQLLRDLDSHLTRPHDRELFGLPPKRTAGQEQPGQDRPAQPEYEEHGQAEQKTGVFSL